MPRRFLLPLNVLLLVLLMSGACTGNRDLDTLLRLKSYIVDPLNNLESWKIESRASAAPCYWLGITCDPRSLPDSTSSAVIGIDLSGKNLSGIISSEIGLLSSLQSLNLAHNNFTGPIPPSITHCSSLKYLNLSDNGLTEGILPGIFLNLRNLETLDLWINSLTGMIPRETGASQRLEHLDLGGNYLEGPIPVEIFNISTLRYLTLAGNSLVGRIPEEISQLQRLEWLYLGYNRLNGSIPASIGAMENLLHLDLVFNELSGPIPGAAIANLSKLEYLFLYTNHLSGEIPQSLSNLRNLISLDLSNNSLTGSIPESLGLISTLEIVNLFQNNLTGGIPASFSTLPRLRTLALWNNKLTGTVDPGLGTASNLTVVDLSTNALTGSIPSALCASGGLFKLILFNNGFTGSIPESIARCRSLKRVRVQNNRLSGVFPEAFAGLPELYYLDVSQNRLSGSIQALNWNCPSLQILLLHRNSITGGIAPAIFALPSLVELDLSANEFSGSIPDTIGKSQLLTELDLSGNRLSGSIPWQIGRCSRLVSINLSDNELSGEIPGSIGQIPTLGSLDLSRNYLSGPFPVFLASMASLEFLNVSMNRLSGPVPSSGTLSAIVNSSSLFGNDDLCFVSSRQLGLPACHVPGGKYVLSWTLGVTVCLCVAVAVAYSIFFLNWRRWVQTGVDTAKSSSGSGSAGTLVLFHRSLRVNVEELMLTTQSSSCSFYECRDCDGKLFCMKRLRAGGNSVKHVEDRMRAISKLKHENVVKVLGIYSRKEAQFLLFQHLPNGSLACIVSSEEKRAALDWEARFQICVGAARGLAFLHKVSRPSKILHGNLSSESIFLDCNLKPLVLVDLESNFEEPSSDLAPELAYSKIITEKTDVYAFGVIILELVTGKRASDPCWKSNSMAESIRKCVTERGWQAGNQFLDVNIVGASPQTDSEIMRVVKVALVCTTPSPAERPCMAEVVNMLGSARQSLPRSIQMAEIATW